METVTSQPHTINISVRPRRSSLHDLPVRFPEKTKNTNLQKPIHISLRSQASTAFSNVKSTNSKTNCHSTIIPNDGLTSTNQKLCLESISPSRLVDNCKDYPETRLDQNDWKNNHSPVNSFKKKRSASLHVENVDSNENRSNLPIYENSVLKNNHGHSEITNGLSSNNNNASHPMIRQSKRNMCRCSWVRIGLCIFISVLLGTILAVILFAALTKSSSNKAVCANNCANNGMCTNTGVCACSTQWTGSSCTTPICSNGCVNGTCTAPDTCVCNSGWNGTACNIAICIPACSNSGTCVSPNVCNCSSGWSGSTCTTPVCSSTCQNGGTCTAPNTCSCPSSYTGATCTIPVCSPSCSNSGTCTSPGVCSCGSTWSGTRCTTPVCSPYCQNGGTCTAPNTCNCTSSYTGAICTIPVCFSTCQNGGTCIAPNTCNCPSTYNGAICNIPVCSPYCQNGGTCSAPNNCTCLTGYSGSRCGTGSCFYGKDTVNLVEGGQRSIEHLKVGDRIWSLNHHGTRLIEDEVIMMADNGPNKPTLFYTFKTIEGHEVSLTDNHNILVYLPNENRIVYLRASKVTLEYQLIMHHQKVKIESISQISRRGYYSPLTLSSYLLVNNISTSIFADSYHVSPEALHHIFAPIRGYYHLLRWIYGKNYDPFETNVTEGLHPFIAWMKYHQTKIRNIYLGLIYIFPIISIVFIVQWFFSKICFGYDKKMDTPFF